MTNVYAGSDTATLVPTRRLTVKERAVFERIRGSFSHLTSADCEQLTQLAEATVRYEVAAREAKKNPTLTVPTFNKSTGNQNGTKIVRNPALTTLKEAQAQMTSLSRRLLIDAASADKRQKLLTRKSRSLAAIEQDSPLTEAAIQERMAAYAAEAYTDPEDACLFLQPGEQLDERGMLI